jgi:hypothetical protein
MTFASRARLDLAPKRRSQVGGMGSCQCAKSRLIPDADHDNEHGCLQVIVGVGLTAFASEGRNEPG